VKIAFNSVSEVLRKGELKFGGRGEVLGLLMVSGDCRYVELICRASRYSVCGTLPDVQ